MIKGRGSTFLGTKVVKMGPSVHLYGVETEGPSCQEHEQDRNREISQDDRVVSVEGLKLTDTLLPGIRSDG